MDRKKKLFLNLCASLIFQAVSFLSGFVLPKIMLIHFGSQVNGLVSSVSHFLSMISLCELGVGAVVQSALYKPLAQNHEIEISKIVVSSDRFFRKIALILLLYTAALMIGYPLIMSDEFDYFYTFFLILIISISSFAQYYFGMTNRLLLSADQMGFIYYTLQTITLILNLLSSVVLVQFGASIHTVKFTTSLIFFIQPIAYAVVVKRRYQLNRKIELTEEPIKQKWNGMAQHLAAVVLGNTDTVVLTLLSTLSSVSVYSVYHLVVHGVRQILVSLTNGVQALFGNMLAKEEMERLDETFDVIEWVFHTLTTIAFSITAMTIIPFVKVYIKGVDDVNYIVPTFAYIMTLAQAIYCIRLPYNMMVLAAGHYKQTQASAIIEAVINIVVSVALVSMFDLVGVAVGTVAAMLYRTCYLTSYLTRNILKRKWHHFLKNLFVDFLCAAFLALTVNLLPTFYALGAIRYGAWIVLAVKIGLTCVFIELIVNFICNRKRIFSVLEMLKRRFT